MRSIVLALWFAFLAYAANVEVALVDVIVTGRGPRKMCLTPQHDELYVSNHDDDTVSVIRVSSRLVTHTVSVCHHPRTIASTRDGTKVFVGCRNAISVITTRDKAVVHLSCCGTVTAFVGTADSRTIYVAGEMQGLFAL
jgi:YVTN family beta-propeller protein